MKEHIIRLTKGDDLRLEIEKYCRREKIRAAYIGTCVGSLQNLRLRKGDSHEICSLAGPFEICSCVGTLSINESHIHIAVSDRDYQMVGGHLIPGSLVFNTAEIVIIELDHYEIARDRNEESGYKELTIVKIRGNN